MPHSSTSISSPVNPRIKRAVKLRQRSHRDELGLMIVEGFREIRRSLDNNHLPVELFYCEELFQGPNDEEIVRRCGEAGASLYSCTASVFGKIAYRDRPEGLMAVSPQVGTAIEDLQPPPRPLIVVAESIEKPGNLGTVLRSADAAGVYAVIVCDRCTDVNNPNVVRASIGTLFAIPVIETSSPEALEWLGRHGIRIVAATPHAEKLYTDVDFSEGTAIVLGTEQYGLSEAWLQGAETAVKIPMLGQSDSLNVAAAATILLYEAVRQRMRA
ncbi:TrmH family RNA methyltransferase [Verrucomicrobiota bacterium]